MQIGGKAPQKGNKRKASSTCLKLFVVVVVVITVAFVQLAYHNGQNSNINQAQENLTLINEQIKEAYRKNQQLVASLATFHVDNKEASKDIVLALPEDTSGISKHIDFHSSETLSSTEEWKRRLAQKLKCMRTGRVSIYHYHMRKAAGTTIQEVLSVSASDYHTKYYETEGIFLNEQFLAKSGLLTVTTLREPINRIISLYWYEHVGWYNGILHQPEKCKTLRQWISAWRDGSAWKKDFINTNPRTNYVEIENYYVKTLIGLKENNELRSSGGKVTQKHLDKAKEVLASLDVVLLMEWLGDDTQATAMNAMFPAENRKSSFLSNKLKGDWHAKQKMTPTLAPDEVEMRALLASINTYDLQLWDYAQSLLAYRLKFIAPIVDEVKKDLGLSVHSHVSDRVQASPEDTQMCQTLTQEMTAQMKTEIGVFRPPKRKGPF